MRNHDPSVKPRSDHPPARVTAYDRLAYTIIVVTSGIITYALGKDTNWDLLNYHFYAPYAYLNIDLAADFMGGGTQRYLNPIGYLPFYWMVKADFHSIVIGLTLGAFHSLNLACIWHLSRRHLFANDPETYLLATLATVLAFVAPAFLGTLGGTFIDPTTSVFILAAVAIFCASRHRLHTPWLTLLGAGLLCGVAAALKLTNLLFCGAFLIALLATSGSIRAGIRGAAWFSVGALFGLLFPFAAWAIDLYREFGNPVFPLFNQYFRSPDFLISPLLPGRFLAHDWSDVLTLPFRMVEHRSWVYIENLAPDLRLAALTSFGAVVCVRTVMRRSWHATGEWMVANRAVVFLVCFFIASFLLWVKSSGNGRYALPILLLTGPLLVVAILRAIPHRRIAISLVIVLLCAQIWVVLGAGNPRWATADWSARWLDIDVPEKLKANHYGYLTLGSSSHSFIAPFLHPDSRFSSVVSNYSIDPDGPGGDRVRQFIDRHAGRLRFLTKSGENMSGAQFSSLQVRSIDIQLAGWGVHVDAADCVYLRSANVDSSNNSFVSCALLEGNALQAGLDLERASIVPVFERVERVCPSLFGPAGVYTLKHNGVWLRRYLNTDITVVVRKERLFFSRYEYGPFDVDMGSVAEWQAGTQSWRCIELDRK